MYISPDEDNNLFLYIELIKSYILFEKQVIIWACHCKCDFFIRSYYRMNISFDIHNNANILPSSGFSPAIS